MQKNEPDQRGVISAQACDPLNQQGAGVFLGNECGVLSNL